jgi:N-methylhydantoinase A
LRRAGACLLHHVAWQTKINYWEAGISKGGKQVSVWLVGVDTGGTFTDVVAVEQQTGELRRAKVPSVPGDPCLAVLEGIGRLTSDGIDPSAISTFVHGTTVATNALLEGKGARVGLLITRGFRAVYEARGWSQPYGSDLLDPFYRKPPLLAPQWLTEEVSERLDYRGDVVISLDEKGVRKSVRRLVEKGVDAIAVCFLFSFVNPTHERRAGEIVAEEAPRCRVSLSSVVLPVIREYPRLSTTVIDAYVGPKITDYLLRLEERLVRRGVSTPQLFLMQSNGGLMRISRGARHPNQTLLSGPAAGVIAGAELARISNRKRVITFDMGGTSTDISVIVDGRVLETTQGQVAGQDIGTPMLKARTLGAGGGTIAWVGKDGLMKVGPISAGADPGPACYGRGGSAATVTDANLVLGALSEESMLAGTLRLDAQRSRDALAALAAQLGLDVVQTAAGILHIVNTQMAVDLRLALQEEGQDPRKFALVAFGGAGPLHAASLARALSIPTVLVPRFPGLNCAMGMLQTNVRHTYLRSEVGFLGTFTGRRMRAIFADLEKQALAEAREEGFAHESVRLVRLLDLRYPHQGYTLPVPCPSVIAEGSEAGLKHAFDRLHEQIYGQSAPAEDAEVVTFRVQSEVEMPRPALPELPRGDGNPGRALKGERPLFDIEANRFVDAKIFDRHELRAGDRVGGPAVIDQLDATTIVPAGQAAMVDAPGTISIEVSGTP